MCRKHRRTPQCQKEATQPCLWQTKSATASSVVAGDERCHFNSHLKDIFFSITEGPTWASVRKDFIDSGTPGGNSRASAHCSLKQAAASSSCRLSPCAHRSQTVLYLEHLGITTQTGLAAGISYFPFAYFPWKSERVYYGVIYFLSSANLFW